MLFSDVAAELVAVKYCHVSSFKETVLYLHFEDW